VILIVWVISPLISRGTFQMANSSFWFRVVTTIFYGLLLTGLIDIRGGFEWWKPYRRPYAFPRFVYTVIGILGSLVGAVGVFYFNTFFIIGLFPNLSISIAMFISVILTIPMVGIPIITYYHIFNEWYEELNG
jgi:hypothetical protein